MRAGIVGCGGHRTGGWGHPLLRTFPCRGRCPQRPVDNGCTSVVPLIRHGCAVVGSFAALRMRRTPCGCCAMPPSPLRGEGFGRSVGSAQMSMAFPSSVTANAVPPSPRGRLFRRTKRETGLRPSPFLVFAVCAVRRITAAAAARPGAPGWPEPAWPERTAPGCCSWCKPSSRRQRRCRGWWTRRPGCSRS